jgi:hypothetical protein
MKQVLVATAARVLAVCVAPAFGRPNAITVHVIDRQPHSSSYSVTRSPRVYPSGSTSASCTSYSRTATCWRSGSATTTVAAGREHGYPNATVGRR